ncbi:GNAT family N-acetyltransferase [Photobacterium indicum]|uniref:GNAT family N-acetyltransferase n=1 Tax=Photobacterium indicum TaxID=81447 RepID=A0A2T3L229_9GAMM|nr:GNAT family N-acetyltransferase [Photobacterium indicum]PSV42748.1 GNAT family N-acetyltransferase [Photobacterium indicum]
MRVRQASLAEAIIVLNQISEFDHPETEDSLMQRLAGHTSLILVAEHEDRLVGVKIGYRLSDSTFYSWLGGVAPAGRRMGIAQALLDAQETWAIEQGYQEIKVKSRNCFPSMLMLLMKNEYLIENIEKKDRVADYRIYFSKLLTEKKESK